VFEGLVWLAPAIVVTTGLWRPRAALVSLAVLLPFFGTSRGGPYLPALDAASIAAIVLCARERRPARTALDLAVLAYVVVGLLSFFPLAYHPPSWRPSVLLHLPGALGSAQSWSVLFTWRALLDLFLGFGLYRSARRAFAGRSARPLGLGLAGGLAILVILGLMEQSGLIGLDGYRAVAARGRLSSLFSNSGWFAQYVVAAAPLATASLLATAGPARLAGYALLPLCLVGLVLAQQRGAWLTVLGQCLCGIVLLRRRLRHDPRVRRRAIGALAAAGVLVTVLAAARPQAFSGLAGRFTRSDLFLRADAWQAAGRLFVARPLLGWGIGSFNAGVDRLDPDQDVVATARGEAHSTYFNIAAERGLLGVLSLVLLMVAATASAGHDLRPGGPEPSLAIGRAIALAGVALYGFVQYVFYVPPVGAIVWMLLGCDRSPPSPRLEALAKRFAPGVIAAALALLSWRVFAVDPLRAAGDYSYGFHRPELSAGAKFEWTAGHAARREACAGDVLVLELANGHPRGAARPVRVTAGIDGREAARIVVRGGWERFRVPLGGACADGVVVLALRAHPTFRPFADFRRYPSLAPSPDERELGVAVRNIRFESAVSATPE